MPPRGVRRRRPRALRRDQRAGDGDLPVVHPAGRGDLARRGVPRRHRRPPAPRRRAHHRRQDPGRRARAGAAHLLGGRGPVEVRGQAGLGGGQAPHRAARARARARREGGRRRTRCSRSSTRCRCRRCGAWARRPSRSSTASGSTPSATWPTSTSGPPLAALGAANGAPPAAAGHGHRRPRRRARTSGRSRSATRRPSPTTTTASTSLQRELVRLGDSVAQRLRAAGHGRAHGHHQGAVPRLPHHHPLDHPARRPSTPAPTSCGPPPSCSHEGRSHARGAAARAST